MTSALDTFKLNTKRRLGWPVVNIELDNDQFDLAIMTAIEFYQRNHFDGSEQMYLPIRITDEISANRYVDFGEDVISVNSIFDLSASSQSLFTVDFMMGAEAAWDAFRNGAGLSGYYQMMSYRKLIQETFSSHIPIRYNYNNGRVYVDTTTQKLAVGSWLIFDTLVAVDPNTNTRMFRDPWLRDYAVACVKEILGSVLKKYASVQLPGGITMNGEAIYNEGIEKKKEMEEEIISKWSLPVNFLIG